MAILPRGFIVLGFHGKAIFFRGYNVDDIFLLLEVWRLFQIRIHDNPTDVAAVGVMGVKSIDLIILMSIMCNFFDSALNELVIIARALLCT